MSQRILVVEDQEDLRAILLAHWLVTAPSIPAHPRLVPQARARETSTPTRSSSLALPTPFEPAPGNARVRGGMGSR
jgi:hypothetical protein